MKAISDEVKAMKTMKIHLSIALELGRALPDPDRVPLRSIQRILS